MLSNLIGIMMKGIIIIFLGIILPSYSLDPDSVERDSESPEVNYSYEDDEYSPNHGIRYRQACLDTHNQLRRRHGAPPMVLNNTLNSKAESWAFKLIHLAKRKGVRNALSWAKLKDIGENNGGLDEDIFKDHIDYDYMSLDEISRDGSYPVTMWYNRENRIHDFSKNEFNNKTGHFTQVIWASSSDLGVGSYTDVETGSFIIVCFYYPAGNINDPESFKANVKKAAGGEGFLSESDQLQEVPTIIGSGALSAQLKKIFAPFKGKFKLTISKLA